MIQWVKVIRVYSHWSQLSQENVCLHNLEKVTMIRRMIIKTHVYLPTMTHEPAKFLFKTIGIKL